MENGMTEKNFLTKTLNDTVISRRSFLKWSAALGGTAALAGGFNYGLKQVSAAAEAAGLEGKWVSAACWHNCGGRCINKAYVVDGIVTKQKTDDTHEDSPNFPQQRSCARGKSQRHHVFGADRLKYPMKRKNWAPGGGDKSLRGRDEWVRISWDEALDLVASELKRIKETYGNEAFLNPSWTDARLLGAYGGFVSTWGTVSYGAWPDVQSLMAGNTVGSNDRLDIEKNSKLIVLWGSNPIWSKGGNPSYHFLQAKQNGAKIIVVDPFYHDSAQGLADEWIPVRPSTDAALLIAMAYYMIENNLQDQEFLDKYTVGFDKDHMPEGANPKDNFKDYVLGTYDGVPKTPEWASEICGTDPMVIRHFAQQVATTKPMLFSSSYAAARTYLGEQYCQAFLAVGWMTGNIGIPGGAVSNGTFSGPALVYGAGGGVGLIENPIKKSIVWDEVWEAVVTGEYIAGVKTDIITGETTSGESKKEKCDIKCIYGLFDPHPYYPMIRGGGNGLNQMPNINRGIEAYRKVEFIVTNDIVLSTKSKYADIVLPATTPWEKPGELVGLGASGQEALAYFENVTEPLYEARDEDWMNAELAKRLGIDPALVSPLSQAQQLYNMLAGAQVIKNDGSGYETLLTITAADIAELGSEGTPQSGRISYQEYKEVGVYQVPRSNGDHFGRISNKAFRDDPEANPLKTASGKLEIYCKSLSDRISGYGWTTTPPIPQYRPPHQGYEDTYSDWENKVKGEYPLQLYTIHYPRRAHSALDNILQLREAFPQEFMINTLDAEARGIKNGDIVKISSPHGVVIRPAYVTIRMIPGVTTLGEGAWVQKDEASGIDMAGATNTLSGTTPSGQGVQPWNTLIVQVEKYEGPIKLEPDAKWPQRIPIKEA
jgi:anaerobic dimethyl sulfoxide reductase subunit A